MVTPPNKVAFNVHTLISYHEILIIQIGYYTILIMQYNCNNLA